MSFANSSVSRLAGLGTGLLQAWSRMEWYATALVLAVLGLCALVAQIDPALGAPPLAVAALAGVAFLAERQSVYIAPNLQMSVSALPVLFAAVVYGPFATMIIAAVALLTDLRPPYTRWVVWTASRVLVSGSAALVALGVLSPNPSFMLILFAVTLAAMTEALGDIGVNSFTVWLRGSGTFRGTWKAMSRLVLSTLPLYSPVIGVLAYSYLELSPWTVLLFFVPALAAQRLFRMYQEQGRLVADLAGANRRLERANISFASALVAALDARDQYTAGHSASVAVYARDIAGRLGLPDDQQQLAHLCGLVHDIGKVGLPAGLLEKPGQLTLDERRRMEEHSVIGERILANVEDYSEIANIVRHHHERVDGNGYPDGLIGDEIPLISKIITVADAYDAMTSDRPYRDAMPSRVARLRLAQAVETQFDTSVVAAFEAILAGSTEEYRSGVQADFAREAQRYAKSTLEAVTTAA